MAPASRQAGVTASGPAAAANQPARAAIMVPGGNYTTDGPLLNYAAQAARRRGAYVHRITWSPPARRSPAAILGQVTTAVERFLDQEAWPA